MLVFSDPECDFYGTEQYNCFPFPHRHSQLWDDGGGEEENRLGMEGQCWTAEETLYGGHCTYQICVHNGSAFMFTVIGL